MKHKFKSLKSLQWGKLNLPYESARTDYRCTICKKGFTHYYHLEQNIYKAMEKQGLSIDNCIGEKKDVEC